MKHLRWRKEEEKNSEGGRHHHQHKHLLNVTSFSERVALQNEGGQKGRKGRDELLHLLGRRTEKSSASRTAAAHCACACWRAKLAGGGKTGARAASPACARLPLPTHLWQPGCDNSLYHGEEPTCLVGPWQKKKRGEGSLWHEFLFWFQCSAFTVAGRACDIPSPSPPIPCAAPARAPPGT